MEKIVRSVCTNVSCTLHSALGHRVRFPKLPAPSPCKVVRLASLLRQPPPPTPSTAATAACYIWAAASTALSVELVGQERPRRLHMACCLCLPTVVDIPKLIVRLNSAPASTPHRSLLSTTYAFCCRCWWWWNYCRLVRRWEGKIFTNPLEHLSSWFDL